MDVNLPLVNARRMREGYCNHPVCLSVCLSFTAIALTYYVLASYPGPLKGRRKGLVHICARMRQIVMVTNLVGG